MENNDGKTVEKNSFQLKGIFLEKLAGDAFSRTNREDAMEHMEKFFKIIGPINVEDIDHGKLWMSVFPFSLTGVASEWFKGERMASVGIWSDLKNKFLDKFYPSSHARRIGNTKRSQSPINFRFEN